MSLVLLSCARLLGGAVWHFERLNLLLYQKAGSHTHFWKSVYNGLNGVIIITLSKLLSCVFLAFAMGIHLLLLIRCFGA